MNTEWEQVNQLFHQALECTDEERSDFIARASREDPALRREVQSLVAMHEENRSFLENPALRTSLFRQFDRWQQQIVDVIRPSASMVSDRMAGQLLDGKYQIEALCGRGGMGAVFRATHVGTGRRVAVKVIAPELAGNREFIERFRREAKTIGLLRHPNIVNVTDFGITGSGDETTAYLVMEYLEGGTLAERLKTRRPMLLDETLAIFGQVCEAMDEAHRHGILHRDLKPENIWLEAVSGNVKVLDFGIARLHDLLAPEWSKPDAHDPQPESPESEETEIRRQPFSITEEETLRLNYTAQQLSRFGSVMGTPKYMSPEQGRGESLDKTSDVYSLGVIAYQMLAGDPPFAGTVVELLIQHREADPMPLREKRWKIPAGIDAVVSQALAKNKDARPATAGAFAFQLLLHTKGNEWIREQADELNRKYRWRLFEIAVRTQWKGWLLSLLLLVASLKLPGMSPAKSVSVFGLLWVMIASFTVWGQSALTAACTLFLGQIHDATKTETDPGSILNAALRAVRRRRTDLVWTSILEIFNPLRKILSLKISEMERLLVNTLIVPPLIQEKLGIDDASKRSATLMEPIRRKTAYPLFRRALVFTLILTMLQAIVMVAANALDRGARHFPETMIVWFPIMLIIATIALSTNLKNAIEQAVLYFTARKALGEIPVGQSALSSRQDAETKPARWWVQWKTYAPTSVLVVLMIGFQLIKFPMMHEGIRDGAVHSVKALNASGVPVPRWSYNSERAIAQAIYHPAMVKYLIEKGAQVNVSIRMYEGLTPHGIGNVVSTPLINALSMGSVATARLLIEHGADVHAQDSIGRTPMTVAITYCPRVIELLLASGVDINEQTRFGTPLLTAARYQWLYLNSNRREGPFRERDNAVRILLGKGADPKTRDNEGRNALMVMAMEPRPDQAVLLTGEALLNAGCEIKAADSKGQTPLIYAVRYGKRAATGLLLKRGADLHAKDHNGESALDWAKKSGNVEIAKLLMSVAPSRGQKHSR